MSIEAQCDTRTAGQGSALTTILLFTKTLIDDRDTPANMSDHTTSGTLLQELVPFALALKLMLHELSMSLTAEAHVRGSCVNMNPAAQTT
jgi:hypothetical protein